jgi:hypothetical protein
MIVFDVNNKGRKVDLSDVPPGSLFRHAQRGALYSYYMMLDPSVENDVFEAVGPANCLVANIENGQVLVMDDTMRVEPIGGKLTVNKL